jgi:hypothetical protein
LGFLLHDPNTRRMAVINAQKSSSAPKLLVMFALIAAALTASFDIQAEDLPAQLAGLKRTLLKMQEQIST